MARLESEKSVPDDGGKVGWWVVQVETRQLHQVVLSDT
jgi:hypothetical protein